MSVLPLSNEAKKFIYDYVDSVTFLEVLFLLFAKPNDEWSAPAIATALRNSSNSIERCLLKMENIGLVVATSVDKSSYVFHCPDTVTHAVIAELIEAFRVQPHKIFELLYSPLKKARDFADAFDLSGNTKKNGK